MRRVLSRRFRRTTLLFWLCVAFLAGVGLARTGHLFGASWCLLPSALALFSFKKKSLWTLAWLVIFGLSFGLLRGSIYMQKLAAYHPLYEHKVSLIATATEDVVYGKNSQLSFTADHVRLADSGKQLAGKIQVSGFGTNAVFAGDKVRLAGKLYTAYGAYQGRISYAQMTVLGHHNTLVAELRRRFAAGMQSSLPEPLASFGMGLLIGQRATLPDQVKQDLLMVGLTHIIAVSGYNLTIMLRASRGLLGKRSKRQVLLLSVALIGVFLLFTGSSASIVRAAIVSLLSIGAAYYGRAIKPLLLIVLAASITAFASPFYVWTDTSWYLSFLAFYGVMVLAPLIQARLSACWQKSLLAGVAFESLCAEIMTLPFVLHTFGQISFIGLLANVLVVIFIPLAMLLAFVAGLAGMLIPAVAGWFAWPARLLLTYMLDVAHLLSRIPHIFVQNLALSVASMIFLYAVIAAVTGLLWRRHKLVGGETTALTVRRLAE